jgi:small multidrug resistance family-3 protein
MQSLNEIVARPTGVFLLLLVAALLEVLGDSCFQSAIHGSSGLPRWISAIAGVGILSLYGLVVNVPQWNFGKLLGVYVVFFFVTAQIVARVRFNQPTSLPVLVGGFMIMVGGAIISFWKG